jgi:hypothetical protein
MATENSEKDSVTAQFVENLLSSENGITVTTTSNEAQIPQNTTNALVLAFAKETGLTFQQAFIAICIICQKGGTAKRALGDIYAIIDGKKVTLALIKEVIEKNKWKFTLRQFARSNATFIYKISMKYSIAGDLYKKISRKHQNISQDESYWLSNFQMDNLECPENLRSYIIEHFKSLFPNSNKTI